MSDIDLQSLVPPLQTAIDQPTVDIGTDEDAPWLFNGKPLVSIPQGHETFVYLITNKINGKKYIGFKTTVSKKTKIVKNKKKHYKVESNWRSYWSSSENLVADVNKYGKKNFIREIIAFTVNKAIGRLIETTEQINRKVITENADLYYNNIVDIRIGGLTVKKYDQVIYCDTLVGDQIKLTD